MNVCYIYYMSFFSNINASPIDRLKNKIEHVRCGGVSDIQKTDNSLIITYAPEIYTLSTKKDITCIELPYKWLIDKIFSKKLDINNINKIEYRSVVSFGEKNDEFIKGLHFTFYVRDKVAGAMLLSQCENN